MAVTIQPTRSGVRPAVVALDRPARELRPDFRVPYQRPELPSLAAITQYYALAEEARWYSNGGPCATLLAQRVGERLAAADGSVPRVVPVANCTLGLMVALRAACGEPRPGRDRIVVPSFTFAASAGAITWAGFTPLFADVDPGSWQLDGAELARILGEQGDRVAGVLACSTFGTAPPVATRAAWRAACAAHGVPLVIDSAAAFGTTAADGVAVGATGDTEVFSLHATKPSAAGEGGLVVTGSPELAERVARLVNFGFDRATRLVGEAGLNAKLSELHAASALAMLDRLDDMLERRRARVARAQALLAPLDVTWQQDGAGSTWQVLQLVVPTGQIRAAALRAAVDLGVEARACFDPPLHRHDAWSDAAALGGDLRVTEQLAARSLSLPMANDLTEPELQRVATVVQRGFGA